ncbi:FecR family protein [Achromobacter insuavis]|uniref:FecR family protein n=1 Tax=Achromobacter insuavis TaxID=1287735 RepID=UPI000E2FFCA4|nr:FecR family protein [Achromobacter insuavis]
MPPTDPGRSRLADAVRNDAARWFARMHAGDASAADRQACERWRHAHPDHERAYQQVEFAWQATSHAPRQALRAILARGESRARAGLARRRLLVGLGAACAATVVGGAALGWADPAWWSGTPQYQAHFETDRGERRVETLPDGSVLELNTGTRLRVRLYDGRRDVALEAGEAMFMVAPDPQRPFIVQAGLGEVRVTGTRFDVRRDAQALSVAVESGAVQVSAGPWWRRQRVDLTSAMAARVDARDGLGAASRADVASLTAWRRGRIIFDGMPLAQAVDEMNRYLRQPLILQDASLAGLRIAASLSVDDPEAIVQALPAIAPVRIARRADGAFLILRR